MEKVVAFVPCRKGSERIKNKNIKNFAGITGGLLSIKLKQLINCELIERIYLSTNDEEIIQFVNKTFNHQKLVVDRRRDELCSSETSTDTLIKYIPELIGEENILWTHVTSPFIDENDYTDAIKTYFKKRKEGFDSSMSVNKIQTFIWDENGTVNYDRKIEKWPRTQTLKPLFEANSGFFISTLKNYIELNDRIGEKPYFHELPKIKSFDIDWEEDFRIAQVFWKERNKE